MGIVPTMSTHDSEEGEDWAEAAAKSQSGDHPEWLVELKACDKPVVPRHLEGRKLGVEASWGPLPKGQLWKPPQRTHCYEEEFIAPDKPEPKDVLFEQALNFLRGAFGNLKAMAQMGPVTAAWMMNSCNPPCGLPPVATAKAPPAQPQIAPAPVAQQPQAQWVPAPRRRSRTPCPGGKVWCQSKAVGLLPGGNVPAGV